METAAGVEAKAWLAVGSRNRHEIATERCQTVRPVEADYYITDSLAILHHCFGFYYLSMCSFGVSVFCKGLFPDFLIMAGVKKEKKS